MKVFTLKDFSTKALKPLERCTIKVQNAVNLLNQLCVRPQTSPVNSPTVCSVKFAFEQRRAVTQFLLPGLNVR